MKPVLDRALPSAKVAVLQAEYTASQQAFREGIYEQRALEFAGEALRKQDLVRWGIIDQKMAEAKTKLTELANRTGYYAGLPDKVYINNAEDKDAIEVYGLFWGEDDPEKISKITADGWESKNWFVSNSANALTEGNIDGLYVNTPSTNCLWPIWQCFIDASNNQLNNDGNYGQLSD
jgi:hypothetical protein